MKRIVRSFFRLFGLEIKKVAPLAPPQAVKPSQVSKDSMSGALQRLKKNGVQPACVIDLGAAAGTWTMESMKHFPSSTYLLFEPLEERKNELKALAAINKNVEPVFAAVGDRMGSVSFVVSDDLDGSGVYDAESGGGNRKVDLVTIDHVVHDKKIAGPFLIKFDTHGFEVPILAGATDTLSRTDAIIMECYGFRIADNCLRFPEMCAHLETLGFRLSDIVNVKRRPGDEFFWQCDAVFIRKEDPRLARVSYQ